MGAEEHVAGPEVADDGAEEGYDELVGEQGVVGLVEGEVPEDGGDAD